MTIRNDAKGHLGTGYLYPACRLDNEPTRGGCLSSSL